MSLFKTFNKRLILKVDSTDFKAPFTLAEGLARTLEFEFVNPRKDDIVFKSE